MNITFELKEKIVEGLENIIREEAIADVLKNEWRRYEWRWTGYAGRLKDDLQMRIHEHDNDPAYILRGHENWRDDRSGYNGLMRCGRCNARLVRNSNGYLVCPQPEMHK